MHTQHTRRLWSATRAFVDLRACLLTVLAMTSALVGCGGQIQMGPEELAEYSPTPLPGESSLTPVVVTATPGVSLLVFPATLSFGEVAIGETSETYMELRNRGQEALQLALSFDENPADQYALEPLSGTIPESLEAGATVGLTLLFSPAEEGDAQGILRIESSDPKASETLLTITGTGRIHEDEADVDGDGFAVVDGDCDDGEALVNPDATEVCDGVDNNCDGTQDEAGQAWYRDADGDGHGIADTSVAGAMVSACEEPPGYVSTQDDCNDLEASVYLDAPEVCDTQDNDCDSEIDEDGVTEFYLDSDGDGFGDTSTRFLGCTAGAGAVTVPGDCNDANPQIFPDAPERCDGVDNDCDAQIDDDAGLTFYLDSDGDGYGNTDIQATGCEAPAGYVELSGDCADTDVLISPAAEEICDGVDNDCDTLIDPDGPSTFYADEDLDGFGNPSLFIEACNLQAGYVANDDDCDDSDPTRSPDAEEVCDDIDNNCDGSSDEGLFATFYLDTDLDGYGDPYQTLEACRTSEGVVEDSTDCNDSDALIHPNALEPCDLVDNNCNDQVDEAGVTPWYRDYDQDGHGDPTVSVTACTAPTGYVASQDDCNDRSDSINPSTAEACNGQDDDCDTQIDEDSRQTWYLDSDGDGFGSSEQSIVGCDVPAYYVAIGGDCDDLTATVNPSATEVCDSVDNNCDDQVDEGFDHLWYADDDLDGYGDASVPLDSCEQPRATSRDSSDCNDQEASVNPDAAELCDGLDNNCDEQIDEGHNRFWYVDDDQDGYGNAAIQIEACEQPRATSLDATDCDDSSATINPGASELCDGVDNDCDTQTDEGYNQVWYVDDDQDGYGNPYQNISACEQPRFTTRNSSDCNDDEPTVNPGATELCDGLDNDCDNQTDEGFNTRWYADNDHDGYGNVGVPIDSCTEPRDSVRNSTDCNDQSAAVSPVASEICDGVDNDCDVTIDEGFDTLWYADDDGDGYGDPVEAMQSCTQPRAGVRDNTDCNDQTTAAHPGATEVCDTVDNDCDLQIDEGFSTTWYADDDGDGFGNVAVPIESCTQPRATSQDSTDCDDTRGTVYPNAPELCDSVDNNCNSLTDESVLLTFYQDADQDGFGSNGATQSACTAPAGYTALNTDCNDADPLIFPGAQETCDGADQDCDSIVDEGVQGTYYTDADLDTFGNPASSGQACAPRAGLVTNNIDCDDQSSVSYPGAPEACDSKDNDCDTQVDEPGDASQNTYWVDTDGDGYGLTAYSRLACSLPVGYASASGDCDDTDAQVHPYATQLCDGSDTDCDGFSAPAAPPTAGSSSPVCDGDTLLLTASNVAGATYAWTGPAGYTSSEQNPSVGNMSSAKAGTYSVIATVDGCPSTAATTVVAVSSVNAAFSGSSSSPYVNQSVTYTPTQSGASYYWTFSGGSPSYSTAYQPTVSWSSAGSYTVTLTVTYNGCQATTSTPVTVAAAALSCNSIKTATPSATSGYYTVDVDGGGPLAAASTYCEMDTNGGGWTRCLNFVNTGAQDISDNNWFDTCVNYSNASGISTGVMLKILNSGGGQSYVGYGTRGRTWSYDQITSTVDYQSQYNSSNHAYMVTFQDGFKLMIAGRSASQSGCGGSMGNGYGMVLYDSAPDYVNNPRAFIMSYLQYSGYGGARGFNGWSTSHEISFNNGASFNSCSSTPGWIGSAEFYVR